MLLESSELAPGTQDAPVQLLLESAAAPTRGERFVVRTYSPARAVAGGTVLDPKPARKYRRGDAAALARFEAQGAGGTIEIIYAQLTARHAEMSEAEVSGALGFPAAEFLEQLADQGKAVVLNGDRYLSDLAARRLTETAQRALNQYHRQNPYKKAMPRESLRAPLSKAATVRDFAALLTFLASEGIIALEGNHGVRASEHEVVLPEVWKKAAEHVLSVYQGARYCPPYPGDFEANYPRDVHIPTILSILCEQDKLVRLSDNLYLSAETMAETKQILRGLAATPEGITVGGLRDATHSSRKIVLPLLEHLDGVRFTIRNGDSRTLSESSPPLWRNS